MPVIVDEVVISVEVSNKTGPASGGGAKSVSTDNQQDIINQCVERVLDILEQREER